PAAVANGIQDMEHVLLRVGEGQRHHRLHEGEAVDLVEAEARVGVEALPFAERRVGVGRPEKAGADRQQPLVERAAVERGQRPADRPGGGGGPPGGCGGGEGEGGGEQGGGGGIVAGSARRVHAATAFPRRIPGGRRRSRATGAARFRLSPPENPRGTPAEPRNRRGAMRLSRWAECEQPSAADPTPPGRPPGWWLRRPPTHG